MVEAAQSHDSGRLPKIVRWYTIPAYALLAYAGGKEAIEIYQQTGGLEQALNNLGFIYGAGGAIVGGGITLVCLMDGYNQIRSYSRGDNQQNTPKQKVK